MNAALVETDTRVCVHQVSLERRVRSRLRYKAAVWETRATMAPPVKRHHWDLTAYALLASLVLIVDGRSIAVN